MAENCFICDKYLQDGTKTTQVQSKGLESLRKASIKRCDQKIEFLHGKNTVQVHEKCRKQYVNERMIASHSKRISVEDPSKLIRSITPEFSFQSHCFLCGEVIAIDSRNPIHAVSTLKVIDNVRQLATNRDDEWCQSILHRLNSVSDLVAADGQYHSKCMKKLHRCPITPNSQKRGPFASEIDSAMETICEYMERNEEQCQFSVQELTDQILPGNYCPSEKTVKTHLKEKYKDDIIIATTKKKVSVVCFKNTGYKILTETWYQDRCSTLQEERARIVETAAKIVAEDIRSQVYETSQYPPPTDFFQENENLIPETLKIFTETLLLRNKKDFDKKKNKSIALAHSIVSSVRPRSFISPLQVGLAAFLYKKFGSRKLIDVLSSLGFCSSYKEAVRFETSAIMIPPFKIDAPAFSQFVYDNADFNTQTLDGHNTFHAMGGIQCIFPKSSIAPSQSFPRIKETPSSHEIAKFGTSHLIYFEKKENKGLKAISINEFEKWNDDTQICPSIPDLLWLYGKHKDIPIPSWSVFMENATKHLPFEQTFVSCLPFVNAPPSNYDTINTVLHDAAKRSRELNQNICIVTFDQPLYIKAREILASSGGEPNLETVVVRLGGFHLLMSFMGAIGYIMAGSGLAELLNTVYAQLSTEKILTGRAYARAVRSHLLVHSVLGKIIMEEINISAECVPQLEEILFNSDRSVVTTAYNLNQVKEFKEQFQQQLRELEDRGPTAQLWIKYFEMVTLIKHFIEAERSSNWNLHLETCHKMLPFFHSSGHFHYAKCCHLYLQDMTENLKSNMTDTEYDTFTNKGGFTIRRTDKFWSGTWTDMTIEQSLMKSMKTSGGLTRGRGVSGSILARWTMGTTALQNVCDEIENFCGVQFKTSEQHEDFKTSRAERDNADAKKMLNWLFQHPPFPKTKELISISSGLVGDGAINCHKSQEFGNAAVKRIIGNDFHSVKFSRSDRVKPLAAMKSTIKMGEEDVIINPTTLFQRISIVKHSDKDLEYFLSYELSRYPLCLFDESGMRKGVKSKLYNAFTPCVEPINLPNNIYVIDGGFLMHKVLWTTGQSFSTICDGYVSYVQSHYQKNAVVVFDGYPEPENALTKSAERERRFRQHKMSSVLLFDESMVPTMSQQLFLANPKNKKRFIALLRKRFEDAEMITMQAIEDADTLIATTAIDLSSSKEFVTVVGEDVDLLVILVGLCNQDNIFLLKPGRNNTPQQVYSIKTCINKCIAEDILFLHAVSGCDSTSAFYRKGKLSFLKTMKESEYLKPTIQIFKDPDADQQSIANAGEFFLCALYGFKGKGKPSINDIRYKNYIQTAYKSSSSLHSLPPTQNAAHQHSLRTYHQVQQWLGNNKPPEKWGWRKTKTGLTPVTTTQSPAPSSLLKLISCKCRKTCRKNCSCKKAGMDCSPLCVNCFGICENMKIITSEDEEEEETILQDGGHILLEENQNTIEDFLSPSADDFDQPGPSKRAKY